MHGTEGCLLQLEPMLPTERSLERNLPRWEGGGRGSVKVQHRLPPLPWKHPPLLCASSVRSIQDLLMSTTLLIYTFQVAQACRKAANGASTSVRFSLSVTQQHCSKGATESSMTGSQDIQLSLEKGTGCMCTTFIKHWRARMGKLCLPK